MTSAGHGEYSATADEQKPACSEANELKPTPNLDEARERVEALTVMFAEKAKGSGVIFTNPAVSADALRTLLTALDTANARASALEKRVADQHEEIGSLADMHAAAERERDGYLHHLRECEQIAGKALGYPWFKDDQANFPGSTEADGVCIGEHIGETIVEALVNRLQAAEQSLSAMKGER